MVIRRSKELLDQLLGGHTLSAAELDALIAECPEEDQFLDYKSGKQDEKKLKHTVRRWITGFANAEGGTLVVGVTESDKKNGRPRKVDGVTAPGQSPVNEWATRLLIDIVGQVSPPPSISRVDHPNGDVLVVAVNRAPNLVPYVEAGTVRYAIRISESTCDAPEFLISDLVLGRRNHPVLEIASVDLSPDTRPAAETLKPRFFAEVQNLGFVAAEEVEVGCVSWSYETGAPHQLNPHLLQYVEQGPVQAYYESPGFGSPRTWSVKRSTWIWERTSQAAATINPFGSLTTGGYAGDLPPQGGGGLSFALYVLPRGSMPTWFEVTCRYNVVHAGSEVTLQGKPTVERLFGRRPKLSWWYP